MKEMPDDVGPAKMQQPDESNRIVSSEVVKNLRCEASALKEIAQRSQTGERPKIQALVTAGAEIWLAARSGLLQGVLDLDTIAPESKDITAIQVRAMARSAPSTDVDTPSRLAQSDSARTEVEHQQVFWLPYTAMQWEQYQQLFMLLTR